MCRASLLSVHDVCCWVRFGLSNQRESKALHVCINIQLSPRRTHQHNNTHTVCLRPNHCLKCHFVPKLIHSQADSCTVEFYPSRGSCGYALLLSSGNVPVTGALPDLGALDYGLTTLPPGLNSPVNESAWG